LGGALLDHTVFFGANLAGANLRSASLRFATLAAAELEGADLHCADLRYARLNHADLTGANLHDALLDYADFTGANLDNANLCGAHLRYAKSLTPTQLEQARTDDSTTLPLHFFEPVPPLRRSRQTKARRRRSRIAGVLSIGLIGAVAPFGLVWQPQHPNSQAAPMIAPARPVTPILASLTPAMLTPEPRVEASIDARRLGPASLTAVSLYPTVLTRDSAALASETSPNTSPSVPAQRLSVGHVTDHLTSSMPEVKTAAEVPLERLVRVAASASDFLNDAPSRLVAAVPATMKLPVREKAAQGPAIVAPPSQDPLTLIVSLSQQKIDVYRGTALVVSSKVSSGKRGYDTRGGVFSILEKHRHHHSNLYSGAPMPWMQRMTWSGTALHGGVVPGYPASHGCVRLPFSFAPKLFQMTNVGENVVVAHDRVAPKPIEHPTLFQPARAEPQVSLALAGQEDVAPDAVAVLSRQSPEQFEADAYDAADDVPTAPLRILITRRTERDRIIAVQYLFASLGYLKRQNFTGRVGAETIAAIKEFQKANGLRATGEYSDTLAKTVYRVSGKAEPPEGHLYVRQDYNRVFDMPVAIRNPAQTLGTHVFTAMMSPPGSTRSPWMGVSLDGDDSASVLDRIDIPDEVHREISARLTPGSSLIVAETSVNSAILREGDDFIVWSNDVRLAAVPDSRQTKQVKIKKAKTKQAKPAAVGKRRAVAKRRSYSPGLYGGFWSFRRW
jgi:lipoprotein-anchoring transpeptidase ErfK/SrfK/peptidoglycan hydrolase-like protein with peptidoglycan-binding domain